jgi:DNA repair photolyase
MLLPSKRPDPEERECQKEGCGDEGMKTGTKEWAEANENCISGCSNNCRYCFGKQMGIQYGRETAETWPIERPRTTARARKHKGRTMFPTTHDLHYEHVQWWGPFLKQLLELGNDVLIVSKPEQNSIRYICQTFAQYRDQIEFRFTIGTVEQDVVAYWEPGAPMPSKRVGCLSIARSHKFRTSVSMEPLLIEDPRPLIRIMDDYITGEIWIGCMNHYKFNPEIPEESRQIEIQSRENMQRVYDSLKDNPKIRWKDSVQKLLGVPQ